MRYSLNPELEAQMKLEWEKIGLSKEIQAALLQFMDAAALTILTKKCRQIAQCLAEEGLAPETIERITGCSVNEIATNITYH
ncbi:hypothetical protein [Rickettsiella endosymbiont of Aleochara curtula]|uniref:hypothetical protein n=1 Tax=Rickettsiella endosymbiont of Aleochara curtula TaxID=3077936 RepID=UPI00313F2EC6